MPRRHAFRFGVEMMEPFDGMTWADSARELESLGYSTLFVPDHLDEGYGPLTAMVSAALATERLCVTSMVLAADFRHPAVLARELASIDQLSGGRLEVGIGAGYQINDYRGSGILMDSPGVRVSRMIEYVAVLRGLFAEGPFTFAGEHYTITDLDGTPPPARAGGPPILVAGGGRRMLTFAGAHADIVGVNPRLPSSEVRAESVTDALPRSIDQKLGWVRDAAGPRFEDLVLHAWVRFARVTASAEAMAQELAEAFHATPGEVLESPIVLMGETEEIIEKIHARRERWGFSYFTIQQPVAREFAPVIARLNA